MLYITALFDNGQYRSMKSHSEILYESNCISSCICYGKCEKLGNMHIFRLLCIILKIGRFIRDLNNNRWLWIILAVFGKCSWMKMNSLFSPTIMHNIKLYLVIEIIYFSNWYLMKSKVKIKHSILKVIYPRGIFR